MRTLILVLMLLGSSTVWSIDEETLTECTHLWIERNTIFAENGYCFSTDATKAYFEEDYPPCETRKPKFSTRENRKIKRITAQERELDCDVSVSAQTALQWKSEESEESISFELKAFVFDPPSNVRTKPNGPVLCSINRKKHIAVNESSGGWYKTQACHGKTGFIHKSQIRIRPISNEEPA